MIEIDVRGFSCPIPVVRTKKAIEGNANQPRAVLVETAVSRENVMRLAESKGYTVEAEDIEDGFCLTLNPSSEK